MTRARGIQEEKDRGRWQRKRYRKRRRRRRRKRMMGGRGWGGAASKPALPHRQKKRFSFSGILKIYCVEFGLVFLYNEFYSRFEFHFHVNVSCILPVFFKRTETSIDFGIITLYIYNPPPPKGLCCSENCDRFVQNISYHLVFSIVIFLRRNLEWFWEMHFCSLDVRFSTVISCVGRHLSKFFVQQVFGKGEDLHHISSRHNHHWSQPSILGQ